MAEPATREQLKQYALRNLGKPVIEINVDDAQLEDRLDEALQYFSQYHYDGVERVYLKYKLTEADKTRLTSNTSSSATKNSESTSYEEANNYLIVPDSVLAVNKIFNLSDKNNMNMFDVRYQMHLNDIYALGFMGSLAEYVMSMQYLDLLDNIIDSDDKQINFDMHKNQLDIFMHWNEEVDVDDFLVVECYRILDPDTYTDVYNDYFLKKYATALIKRQWGQNLLKFEGMQMPGGVTFNGRQLYDDAIVELEQLTEEARLNWEQPVDFYTG